MILSSAFIQSLQHPQFQVKPVYLIYGEEPLFILEAYDLLRQKLASLGFASDERFEVEASFDWKGLEFDLMTDSLFAQQRFLVLNLPKGNPGKDGFELLQHWLRKMESQFPDTVLIILCEKLDSRQVKAKWVQLIESLGAVVQAKTVPAQSLPNWLMQRANQYGLQLQADAVNLLVERIEGNLLAADQEFKKMALIYPQGHVLTGEHIQAVVADQSHYQLFALGTNVLLGKPQLALQIYQRLRQEGVETIVILWALMTELRALDELVFVSAQAGMPQAFKQLRIWNFKQAEYRAALGRGQSSFWRSCLQEAAVIDQLIKGIQQKISDAEIELKMTQLIVKMAQTPSR